MKTAAQRKFERRVMDCIDQATIDDMFHKCVNTVDMQQMWLLPLVFIPIYGQ